MPSSKRPQTIPWPIIFPLRIISNLGRPILRSRELEAAFGKAKFNDLTLERMQFNEEAYRANGFSESESRSVAMFQLPLPLLKEMRSLAENMIELSKSYRQAGDTASADAAVAITLKLGEQFRNSGNALLVHQLLGIGHRTIRFEDFGS